ncbi:(deoxy)nucleoside triphosphate pyrophosphohydrolase [Leifsonia sp. NPDC058194]|uniref:(deoxy)nucleoside triphosphate pyrophosphohydrolase n=1 Tax=Leifsonia sp. NPDC058194 TaxID=3346374 RepID=UPI0036DA6C73
MPPADPAPDRASAGVPTTAASALAVVAAVIADDALADDALLLACRRAPGRDAAGRWEFPGGKVEAGEAPQAALEREIREELGVPIHVGALLDRTTTIVGSRAIDLACYAATLAGAVPERSTDHDLLRWVSREELGALDWADADRPVVRLLQEERTA